MRRLWRYIRRGFLTLAILVAVVIVAVAILSQTHRAREYLRQQTVSYLNSSYKGQFNIDRIDGSLFWGLTLHNLVVRKDGAEILRVTTISAGYSILELMSASKLSSIEIDRAVGHLARDPNQQWNLLTALSPKKPEPQPKTTSKSRLTIGDLVLRDCSLEITQAGKTYRIEPVLIAVYLNLDGSAIEALVRRVALRATAPGLPNLLADGSLAYHARGTPASLEIPALTLSTSASQVRIFGGIRDLNTLDNDITVSVDRLAASDIERYVPKWSAQQNLSGTIRLRGPKKELRGNVDLLAANGKINAQTVVELAEKTPSFRGMLNISGFDIGKAIQGGTMQGVLDASIKGQGTGTALDGIEGDAALSLRGARMGGVQTRLITMQAGLKHSVATAVGELTGGVGNASWRGQLNLGPARTYNLTLFLNHLNVTRVSAGKQRIDSNLNMHAQVDGSGFDLANAKARADVAVLPSTVGRVRIARGQIGARIAERRVRTNIAIIATAARLKAHGEVALTADRRAQLGYELRFADLGPWLGLTGQQGSGRLDLDGRATGSFESLRTQDDLRFAALRYGTSYIGCGSASIDMNEVGKPGMHGNVAFSMNQIQSGVKLKTVHLTASLGQLRPVTVARVSVSTEDERSLKNRVDAEIRKQPATTEVNLTRLSIQDPDETWTNQSPARIMVDERGLTIERFLLASGQSRILLDGRASKVGTQNLLLQIDKLRLAAIKAVLQKKVDLSGSLSMQSRVGGTAAAPIIHFASSISGLRAAGQSYQGLSATLSYEDERANLELAFRQDSSHSLTANGRLPIALSWAQGFQMKPRGDVDFRATSSGLSLAVLNALATGTVREANGTLLLNLVVKGPLTHPVPTGFVKLQKATAMIVPTGVKIDDLEMATDFTPQLVHIAQLHMTAGDGHVDADGRLGLENYKPGNVRLAIRIVDWPAIRNQQYRATASGQINVAGSASAPAVTGNVEILNALLRPDIAFLTSGPPPPDPTIHLVSQTPPPPPMLISVNPSCPPPPKVAPAPVTAKPVEKKTDAQKGVSVDMWVRLRRDIWVKQENGTAELTGDVHVIKSGSEPVRLIGQIQTVRGWLGVMGKQFKVASAKITFTGGVPIDPGLDITADYQAQQYLVHVIVGGTANKPTLTFKSEPDLEQADILSVILFGKPTSQLSGGERADLKSHASEVATGFAASQVSRQVSQALGLDEMGIELRQSGKGVGVGSYLGQNTYASFSQDLGQQGGQRVDLEHYVTRHLEVDTDTTARGDRGADILWSTSY